MRTLVSLAEGGDARDHGTRPSRFSVRAYALCDIVRSVRQPRHIPAQATDVPCASARACHAALLRPTGYVVLLGALRDGQVPERHFDDEPRDVDRSGAGRGRESVTRESRGGRPTDGCMGRRSLSPPADCGLLLRRASGSRAINDSGSPPSAADHRTEQISVTRRSIEFEFLKPQRVGCRCPS